MDTEIIEPLGKHALIYHVVKAIPTGFVATYGDVAALAGLPGHARLVGYALHALPAWNDPLRDVPWHRVINAQGKISLGRISPDGANEQRQLLEAEGITFKDSGKIDLRQYRWMPH